MHKTLFIINNVCLKEEKMLKNWLENESKETLICAVVSAISLVLSITGVLKNVLLLILHCVPLIDDPPGHAYIEIEQFSILHNDIHFLFSLLTGCETGKN